MAANVYEENDILHQSGVELVCLLYAEAISRVSQAMRSFETPSPVDCSKPIGDAMAIILELQSSLDLEEGGEIARDLARLYDYIQQSLLHALGERSSGSLRQVKRLLETLLEGWLGCRDALRGSPGERPWTAVSPFADEPRAWTV